MPRRLRHPDRTAIEIGVGAASLVLGGILLGFFATASHHWAHIGDLLLLVFGLICVAFGVYAFAQFYWPWLPWLPEPRLRRPQAHSDSDDQLIERARQCVAKLGMLWAQHTRYTPGFWDEDAQEPSHSSWAKSVNRSRRHEQDTAARFFENHYADVVAIASELHVRGALTDEEIRHLNWTIGTGTLTGSIHGLSDIGPALLTGAQRLETERESK